MAETASPIVMTSHVTYVIHDDRCDDPDQGYLKSVSMTLTTKKKTKGRTLNKPEFNSACQTLYTFNVQDMECCNSLII